jgi:hypothetical protein
MSIKVYYRTEARFSYKLSDPGKGCERSFDSLEEAKAAPFPVGCMFAYVEIEKEMYVFHSAQFGWEFFKKE